MSDAIEKETAEDERIAVSELLDAAMKLLQKCQTMNFGNWDYDDMNRAIGEFFDENGAPA